MRRVRGCFILLAIMIFPTLRLFAGAGDGGSPVRVGFSKADVSHAGTAKGEFRKPLEAVIAVFTGSGRSTALIAVDAGAFSIDFNWDLQNQIARRTGIPAEEVLIHATHAHTAMSGTNDDLAVTGKMADAIAPAVKRALAGAVPARIVVGEKDVGKRLSVYRRGDTGPEMGVQSLWYGYIVDKPGGRADASAMINDMKARWMDKGRDYRKGAKPIYFDHDVDPLVQAVSFETMDGKPIGTIVRFCAHPHLAVHFAEGGKDPDFPGVVREVIERRRGGVGLFVLGPSGNLVPREKVRYQIDAKMVATVAWDSRHGYLGPSGTYGAVDSAELEREINRIGTEIAEAALASLAAAKLAPLATFTHSVQRFREPLDPALPRTKEERDRLRIAMTAEYDDFLHAGGPLRELRRLANRLNWVNWGGTENFQVLTDADRKNGYKDIPISVMRINELVLVFMPSEIMLETTLDLRKAFPRLNLWTVSLTGGGLGYLPTAQIRDEGGYEGRKTVAARDTERLMREHISQMLRAGSP